MRSEPVVWLPKLALGKSRQLAGGLSLAPRPQRPALPSSRRSFVGCEARSGFHAVSIVVIGNPSV